jgi:hypothetical protein
MLLKDKFSPVFLKDFIINKDVSNVCSKLISNNYIPHMLFHGPIGSGKYTTAKSIINTIYGENIVSYNKIFKINGKEIELKCSNYHFEILIDKYNSNRSMICDIIDYFTETQDINAECHTKIIIIRNLNYLNPDFLSFLKNKMEVSNEYYRFFTIAHNVSYIPNKFRGLFTYIRIAYNNDKIINNFFKTKGLILPKCSKSKNLNELLTLYELDNSPSYKTFNHNKQTQIISLIKDAINNPDNILKIRDILYIINIKNIKVNTILKNILRHFIDMKDFDFNKKKQLCEICALYDERTNHSYKNQIHYEALFSKIIYIYHS